MKKFYLPLALLSISLIGSPEAMEDDEIENDVLKKIYLLEKEGERDKKQLEFYEGEIKKKQIELYEEIRKKDWIQEWKDEASNLLKQLEAMPGLSQKFFHATTAVDIYIKNIEKIEVMEQYFEIFEGLKQREIIVQSSCSMHIDSKNNVKLISNFIEILNLNKIYLSLENFENLKNLNSILKKFLKEEIASFEETKKSVIELTESFLNFLTFSEENNENLKDYILYIKEQPMFKEIIHLQQEINNKQPKIINEQNIIKTEQQRFESRNSIHALLYCLKQVIKGKREATWKIFDIMLSQKKDIFN